MKGIIIYKGKYGATQQYAQWLSNSLTLPLLKAENAGPGTLEKYDLVILGSSVYIGKLIIREWLKQNLAALAGKKLFLFVVCGTPADAKDELQKIIENNLDAATRKRTKVFFLPGRCVVSKLYWTDRFMLKMGAMLEKDPKKKATMKSDYDLMDEKQLDSLIAAAREYPGSVLGHAGNNNISIKKGAQDVRDIK